MPYRWVSEVKSLRSSALLLILTYHVHVCLKEDISKLMEEGRLESKLNELDKLENAAKNNLDPAWSVKITL